MLKKLIGGTLKPKYDAKYLKELRDSYFAMKGFTLNNKNRHVFENHMSAFKKYTE
jgi:hypothetical protein